MRERKSNRPLSFISIFTIKIYFKFDSEGENRKKTSMLSIGDALAQLSQLRRHWLMTSALTVAYRGIGHTDICHTDIWCVLGVCACMLPDPGTGVISSDGC